MNVQRPERKDLLCWGEIYNYRDVSGISGKMYKVFNTKSRRLTRGEENALAIAGLRMASEKRMWVAGEPHEVSVGSVMSKVFNNPRLMARTIFQSWFKRMGMTLVKHSTATRGVWILVPRTLEGHEAAFGDTGPGTCWQILVKTPVLYEALKLHADNKWQKNTPRGDAVTGSHSILGSPEGHQDSETGEGTMDPSGCLQAATPAQSPHNAAANREVSMGLPIIPPEYDPDAGHAGWTAAELYRANKDWLEHVDRINNEIRDNVEMAVNPPWIGPSDPATVVEDLNKIDRLLDEAEQMSQPGYGEHDEETELEDVAIMPAPPPAASGTINVTLERRIDVPPEVRGWEDDD